MVGTYISVPINSWCLCKACIPSTLQTSGKSQAGKQAVRGLIYSARLFSARPDPLRYIMVELICSVFLVGLALQCPNAMVGLPRLEI